MLELITFFSYIIFFFSFFKAFKIIAKKFRDGYFTVAMPLVLVMMIFLLLPIILDLTIGKPDFSKYIGFYNASKSVETDIFYNIYISFTLFLIYRYIKKQKNKKIILDSQLFYKQVYKYRYVLWIAMLLPVFAVLASTSPLEYLNYKALLYNRTLAFKSTHAIILKATLFSSIAASLLFYTLKDRRISRLVFLKYLFFSFLLFFAFWVDGKRGIIVKFVFLTLIAGWLLGILKPKKLIKKAFLMLAVLVLFISSYGKDFDSSSTLSRGIYDSFRLNLGRDHTIKYTLFKELVLEKPILTYRGQSFFFDLVFFIPRSFWSGKPYPYAVYYVTSVLNVAPEPLGWSFTTCILEEMISNLGYLGFICGPLFLLWICKIGDNDESVFLKLLSILLVVFFMFTQLNAFMPVFLIFLIIIIKNKFRKLKFL